MELALPPAAPKQLPLPPQLAVPACASRLPQKWVNSVGKAQGRKGKRLFMPMRVAFTGRMAGPDVGDVLAMLALEQGDVAEEGAYVPVERRMEELRAWLAAHPAPTATE